MSVLASRTPRCTRSTKLASWRAAPRCTARSNRAAHLGRTGPCVQRIIGAGIARVVAAMEDPFPLVRGRGFAILRAHGVDVEVGLEADAALRLNQPFLTAVRDQRPFVILKSAVSADGYVAAGPGERTPITSAAALRHAQFTRAWVDAIGVGSETVLVDNPLLTARDVYRERPLARVVFDRRLRTPPDARLLATLDAGPVIIVTGAERMDGPAARALAAAGATRARTGRAGHRRRIGDAALTRHSECADRGRRGAARCVLGRRAGGLRPTVPGAAAPWARMGWRCRGTALLLADDLFDRRVTQLGPDQLTEGYVHRPR